MKTENPRFWIEETEIDFDDSEPPIIWNITLFKVSTLGGVTKEMEEKAEDFEQQLRKWCEALGFEKVYKGNEYEGQLLYKKKCNDIVIEVSKARSMWMESVGYIEYILTIKEVEK